MEPTDFNALAFDQNSTRDPLQKHFIPREGSRKRGLEIEFDPTRHREWVTGFRKRKAERKTAARKSLEIKAKEERLVDRKKRFEEKKKNLNLPDDYGVGDMNDDEHAAPEKVANQTRHCQAGITTVVTTSAIAYDSDDHGDAPSSSSDDEGDQHQPRAVLAPTRAGSRSNIGVVENPAERSHGKPKQKQSSADRLAKLKLSQGKKSKSRGPRAKVSKSRKGKPGKGKRT